MSDRKMTLCLLLIIAQMKGSLFASAADDVVAYRGATIETVSASGTITNGTIVIRAGKIVAVGTDVSVPAEARVVDVTGQTIMPALVNIYHPVAAEESPAPTEPRIFTGGRCPFPTPGGPPAGVATFSKLSDNLDPLSLRTTLSSQARYGVGFINVVTRGYGQSVHIKVTPDDAENCIVNKDGSLYLAVTNNTSSLDVLRNGLQGRPSAGGGSGGPGGRSGGSRGSRGGDVRRSDSSQPAAPAQPESTAPTGNSLAALWQSVKDGNTPVVVNVNNASTILYVLQIKKEFEKVRIVLVASGANIYQTRDSLKDSGISILMRAGLDVAPRSSIRINVPEMLEDAGISFAFSPSLDSSLDAVQDTPLFPVTQLVKTGLSRKAALEALTLSPAKMLGLDKSLGSIEVGKQANLIFFDGDPLTEASQVQQVLVEGNSIYED